LLSNVNEQDNILFGGQIKELDLNTELIVLSACETGTGRIFYSEGVNSLAGSFAIAQVPNVISSLWKVADKSTSMLMVEFYKNLHESHFDSYSISLHNAKLLMIKSKGYSNPFFWAPFIITRY